jgi:predicted transcriptional regulator
MNTKLRSCYAAGVATNHAENAMSTTSLDVPLSDQTRERLKELANRNRKSEAEIAATLIEGALAADELEVRIIRDRLAQADAGGPFVRQEDVLAWLKALSEGKRVPAPKATVTS